MCNYPNSGELYHWKYIRRERVNGKWRYYYEKDNNRITTTHVTSKSSYESDGRIEYGDGTVVDNGPQSEYRIASDKTKGVEVEVDKKTYDNLKIGKNRMVGDVPLKDVNKQNLDMAKSFVKDLIAGNVHMNMRPKKKSKK
mgnify:CR=1 FL=1